jgi:hypothetical protein
VGTDIEADGSTQAVLAGNGAIDLPEERRDNDSEKATMSGLRTAVLLFLIAIGLSLLVGYATSDNVTINSTVGSYVVVQLPSTYNTSPFSPPQPPYRIAQGQDVYLNDTIDITGEGWGRGIAWYGTYGEYDDPQYVYEFSDFSPHGELSHFWIDPSIFAQRLGMWYEYYGNATETRGNLNAFKVIAGYRNSTLTFPNGTVVNQSVGISPTQTPRVFPQESVLPEVHVADYLLAIGDPLIVKTYGQAQVWIFGRVDKAYGTTNTDNMTFDAKTFENFEPGSYTMVVQHPGNNTDFDVRFNNNTLEYKNGWNGVQNVDVSGLQPRMILSRLLQILESTDDTYQTYTVEIQQPEIRVVSIDDIWLKSKMDEFHIDNNVDVTFKDIRGYTNLQNGTNLTVALDKTRFVTHAQTWRSANGNRTMFQAYVPIIWDTIPLGTHTVTVSGPPGAYVDANFPVELLPADSYRPNATLKYTGDENPWKPNLTTPTPVIITQVVTQVVVVTVTPSQDQIKQKSMDAVMQIISDNVVPVVEVVAGVLIGFLIVRFVYRAGKRRMWLKK